MDLKTGIIERCDKGTVVRVQGKGYLLSQPGVVCENPEASEGERIYSKLFADPEKRIYLPGEYDLAVAEVLARGPAAKNVLRVGANGYSDLSLERCRAWGIKPGSYQEACFGLLLSMYEALCRDYPGVDVRFVHGASNVGIDKVLIALANKFERPQLGHSCPGFMFYVDPNDKVPVYCAATKEDYADAFIRSLDVLVACNGGEQAFVHDISSMFRHKRHLIPVNILRSISDNGGPPAVDADGKIVDAVAAFEQHVHMMGHAVYEAADPYIALVSHVCDETSILARRMLSPTLAFSHVAQQLERIAGKK